MNDVKYEYGCEITSTSECPLREEIRAEVIEEFVKWAYIHGIDFSFMGKIKEDGKSDVPQRLQNIKDRFYNELKEDK